MSQRGDHNYRLALYRELNEIVSAMKNLAQVELHRIQKAESQQQLAFDAVLDAMALFQQKYPGAFQVPGTFQASVPFQAKAAFECWVLMGSERGFCGGFNGQVHRRFIQAQQLDSNLWVIGSRLAQKFSDLSKDRIVAGPATVEEVLPCAEQMLDALARQGLPKSLTLVHHAETGIQFTPLLPGPELSRLTTRSETLIQLAPAQLKSELQWHVLQQGLIHYLLQSLKIENRWRLQQMEGARQHLEDSTRTLQLTLNRLRQQEIIEEIEVILVDTSFS